jgi:hypothetical protein
MHMLLCVYAHLQNLFRYPSLLCQLYSGDIPFHGYPDLQALFRIINGDRPTCPTFQSGLCVVQPSYTIWNLITRCWDHIPDCRPTMAEVLNCLKAASDCERRTVEFKLAIEKRDLPKVHEYAKQVDVRVVAQGLPSAPSQI